MPINRCDTIHAICRNCRIPQKSFIIGANIQTTGQVCCSKHSQSHGHCNDEILRRTRHVLSNCSEHHNSLYPRQRPSAAYCKNRLSRNS